MNSLDKLDLSVITYCDIYANIKNILSDIGEICISLNSRYERENDNKQLRLDAINELLNGNISDIQKKSLLRERNSLEAQSFRLEGEDAEVKNLMLEGEAAIKELIQAKSEIDVDARNCKSEIDRMIKSTTANGVDAELIRRWFNDAENKFNLYANNLLHVKG